MALETEGQRGPLQIVDAPRAPVPPARWSRCWDCQIVIDAQAQGERPRRSRACDRCEEHRR